MDYQTIYRDHADAYDELIGAEDCDRNLLPALEAIRPLTGARVVDVGTGTGRIARLVVARAAHVVGVEPSAAMLAIARRHLEAMGVGSWELHQGSADRLPVPDASADVAVAAWVLGHTRHWHPQDWRTRIAAGLAEMDRALVPAGTLVLLETLGTARDHAAPPNEELAEYYRWLEDEQGFTRATIRTDYAFPDVATAVRVCATFFGEAMGARITERSWARVPEHTGLWSRPRRAKSP